MLSVERRHAQQGRGDMNLVERAKAILQNPKSEWKVIEGEQDGTGTLFWNYVIPLAAIPPAAAFVGTSMTGYVGYRLNFFSGLTWAVTIYVLTLASVWVTAFIIDFLAGAFGARKNFGNAMRVSVYAPTAAWLAGVFDVNPALAFLSLMGLYSFYLLSTGLGELMKPPAGKLLAYTIAVVLCIAVLWLIALGLAAMTFGLHLSEFTARP
jgi:Yip1 domain